MRGNNRAPGQGATINRNRASRGPSARNNNIDNRNDRRDDLRDDRVRNYPNNDDGTSAAERRARLDRDHPQLSGPGSAVGLPGNAQPGSGLGLPNQRDQDGQARPGLDNPTLFGDPTLAERMGFDQDQFGQFSQAYNNALRQYEAARAQLPPDLSNQERNARLSQLRQQFNQQFMEQAGDFFQNPLQRERFQQLQMQYQGFDAFDDPTIQDHLRLTGEQKVRLNRLAESWNQQLHDFYQEGTRYDWQPVPYFTEDSQGEGGNALGTLENEEGRNIDPETAFQQMQRQRWQQIYNVLDDEQRYKYFQMTGSPYSFPMQAYMQGVNSGNAVANQGNQAQGNQGVPRATGYRGADNVPQGQTPQGQPPQGASTPPGTSVPQGTSTPQGASTPQGTSTPGALPSSDAGAPAPGGVDQ